MFLKKRCPACGRDLPLKIIAYGHGKCKICGATVKENKVRSIICIFFSIWFIFISLQFSVPASLFLIALCILTWNYFRKFEVVELNP
jgi:ssDNA-binding Zn-finger/Zn-ribbon topoisomerase 1